MNHVPICQIQTEQLVLRKLRAEDAENYYRFLGGSEAVTRFMLFHPHGSLEESVASVEKALGRYEEGGFYRWGVTRKGEDSLIGVIDLLRIDDERKTCSFAYMLAESCWGRGYGTQMLRAVLEFAFRNLGMETVEADHMAENPASGAVMRKAGMEYVETVRNKYCKNGEYHDAHAYRIDRKRWEEQTGTEKITT